MAPWKAKVFFFDSKIFIITKIKSKVLSPWPWEKKKFLSHWFQNQANRLKIQALRKEHFQAGINMERPFSQIHSLHSSQALAQFRSRTSSLSWFHRSVTNSAPTASLSSTQYTGWDGLENGNSYLVTTSVRTFFGLKSVCGCWRGGAYWRLDDNDLLHHAFSFDGQILSWTRGTISKTSDAIFLNAIYFLNRRSLQTFRFAYCPLYTIMS